MPNSDESLVNAVSQLLKDTKTSIATAESCTGGLLAKLLTDVSGSSAYFSCGWVTYSNAAKSSELGVDPMLIDSNGAVSDLVASARCLDENRRLSRFPLATNPPTLLLMINIRDHKPTHPSSKLSPDDISRVSGVIDGLFVGH